MDFLNKIRKIEKIRFYASAIVISLLITVISVIGIFAPKTERLPAKAVISDIQSEYDGAAEQTNYSVYVDYEIDGQKYTHIDYGSYNSSMKVGDTVDIEYSAEDPENIQSPGSEKIPYITGAVGLAVLAACIVMLIKSAKQKSDDLEEYNRVDMSKADPVEIEKIRNSTEPLKNFTFQFDTKFPSQNYLMKDENKNVVYEAKMTKFSLVKPVAYDFINVFGNKTTSYQIGHTVSTSIGRTDGFGYSVPISSAFTIDGVKNWDWLAERGYGFNFRMNGIKPCFDVMHYGENIAYIETAGTEILKDTETKNPIAKLPTNGLFRVQCRYSDIDMIFMICLSISRAIFYENN